MVLEIPTEHSGTEAMAFDAAMLTRAESGFGSWRVYFWGSVWVTLGHRQQACCAIHFQCEVPYAHRPTGGLAVLHGHDLTFSYALPLASLSVDSRRVRAVFEALTAPLVEAFGGEVRRGGGVNSTGDSEDCFAGNGEYDLVDGSGKKVCGCAMRVNRQAALLQASIPLRPPLLDPSAVIYGGAAYEGSPRDPLAIYAGLQEALKDVPEADRGLVR